MLDKDQEYRRGEPIDYTSCYGYPKVKFQIVRVSDGSVVGHAKQELVPGDDGAVWTKVYYTRDIGRNYGMLRFYASPEALIRGFGGKVSEWLGDKDVDVSALKNEPKSDPAGESLAARVTALEDKVFLGKLPKVRAKLKAKVKVRKAVAKPPARRAKKLA